MHLRSQNVWNLVGLIGRSWICQGHVKKPIVLKNYGSKCHVYEGHNTSPVCLKGYNPQSANPDPSKPFQAQKEKKALSNQKGKGNNQLEFLEGDSIKPQWQGHSIYEPPSVRVEHCSEASH